MSRPLRENSPRPTLLVDEHARRIRDPSTNTYIGVQGPLGRERIVSALPLAEPPPWQAPLEALMDNQGTFLSDPDGNLIGFSALWIPRMLAARWTEDTRRLAG